MSEKFFPQPQHSPLLVLNKGLTSLTLRIKDEAARFELPSWLAPRRPTAQEPVDAITREIPEASEVMFVYQRHNGVVVKCDALRLIEYMLETGDFLDPETRLAFEPDAIAQLDVFCKRLGKPLVSDARLASDARRAEQHFVRDALLGLERLAGEKVAQILDVIEAVNDDKESPEDAQLFILQHVLPEFRNLFMQIAQTDSDFAGACCSQFQVFLKGPPNRPTKDDSGLLSQCLHLLRSTCEECF